MVFAEPPLLGDSRRFKTNPEARMGSSLTIGEAARLTEMVAVVDAFGQQGFLAGDALRVIRDERLWTDDATSFEEFCQAKWGYGKAYSYRLIDASKVIEQLTEGESPIGDCLPANESQARAISKIPPKKRKEVLKKAAQATKGRVTAKAIAEAASEKSPIGDTERANEQAFAHRGDEYDTAIRSLKEMRKAVSSLAHGPSGPWLLHEKALESLDFLRNCLINARYYAVCPECVGKKCQHCRMAGWVPQWRFQEMEMEVQA